MDNRLVLAGRVASGGETRTSPAGIPITRFTLEHTSQQMEAGRPRRVECRLGVMACGEGLAATAGQLAPGSAVRISGFLCRANNRQGESRLILHAQEIERLADPDSAAT